MMAVGLQDSRIKLFSLTPSKLKAMKSAQDLETVDREADDVLFRMMDEKNASESKVLAGHQGPVTSLSFRWVWEFEPDPVTRPAVCTHHLDNISNILLGTGQVFQE